MNKLSFTLVALAACAADPDPIDGPPFVDDSELLRDGKADGGPGLGTSTVLGEQAGYRSVLGTESWCTPGGKAGFDIQYVNNSLPWGVTLDLWRGMYVEEWCGGCEPAYDYTIDWADHQVARMNPSGPWTWSVHTESYGYGSGAGGRFIGMRYVVRITMPDGSVRWDNGGSNVGFYQVLVPDPKCDDTWEPYVTKDSPLANLPVVTVPRY